MYDSSISPSVATEVEAPVHASLGYGRGALSSGGPVDGEGTANLGGGELPGEPLGLHS